MELQDKIGREPVITKFVTLIEHLAQDKNICVALDGDWGSGKSFLLDKLCEHLDPIDNYLVVRYDAWECSFYDEPLIAILSSIVDSAFDKLPNLPGGKQALKNGGKRLGMSILEELSSKPGKLGFLATIVKKIITHISSFKEAATIDTKDGKVAEFKSYQSYLKEVRNSLNEFTTHRDSNGKQNKLIILVDELDRCLPDMQLKILERLHHLFDVKNCAVVCAINANSIVQNVSTTYGVDGFEYLRKFFDLTYRIDKSTATYMSNLLLDLSELTKTRNEYAKNADRPVQVAYLCFQHGTNRVLNHIDNREATRFYESLVNVCDDFGWENLSAQYLFFIIIAMYIKKYLDREFLSNNDILTKNKEVELTSRFPNADMPFFDYIKWYLGIDRENLPNELDLLTLQDMPVFIWDFNEMVYRCIEGTPSGKMNKEKCMRLRELILIYGGEPAKKFQ